MGTDWNSSWRKIASFKEMYLVSLCTKFPLFAFSFEGPGVWKDIDNEVRRESSIIE